QRHLLQRRPRRRIRHLLGFGLSHGGRDRPYQRGFRPRPLAGRAADVHAADAAAVTGDYDIRPETPSAEDYLRLRVAAGLSPKTAEQAAKGLPNTWFGII